MSHMFHNATAFSKEIGSWDTSNVSYVFYKVTAFNREIDNWDTQSVMRMSWMFHEGLGKLEVGIRKM
jgi:hypothetical protein